MHEPLIDLTDIRFWTLVAGAMVLVAPLKIQRHKQLAWAITNTLFLITILELNAIWIIAWVLILWVTLKLVASRYYALPTILISALLLTLFSVHKSAWLASFFGLSTLRPVLSVIGFSYVALRTVELLRAIYERRYDVPSIRTIINYLMPLHMLAAGPIQSYEDFASHPIGPAPGGTQHMLRAVERIVFGLSKKFVLAYLIQNTFLTEFQTSGWHFFAEVQLFFLWLYLDFSAYSDIAIGIGGLLGIRTPENFNRPYLARNVVEFWERWHISLSHFVRRNVFTPIQLNLLRRSNSRAPLIASSIAFFVAFVLCGLWHGLALKFFLWGAFQAVGLIVTNLYREFLKRKLGSKGVKAYLQNRSVLWLARFMTYEFVAFSLVILFIP